MELAELDQVIPQLLEKVTGLEAEVAALKKELKPRLAEWSTLREACVFAGQSYHTLRRTENKSQRPDGGVEIRGITRYPREAVESWSKDLGR